LKAAGFERVEASATGRPGYAPGDLLKLYIHGYLNRVRSSRRLEAECHRNIEVIWVLRTLKPDFKTIADFRADNRKAFRMVFREFVLLCRKLDLFGRELLAVYGTHTDAHAWHIERTKRHNVVVVGTALPTAPSKRAPRLGPGSRTQRS
jgi:transposase